jgi:hypothetical protein
MSSTVTKFKVWRREPRAKIKTWVMSQTQGSTKTEVGKVTDLRERQRQAVPSKLCIPWES